MKYTRRTFIKTGLIATAGASVLWQGCALGADKNAGNKLFELFRNPSGSAKPFVRWWWNGNKLSAKEILRELDIMKEAGIGGVEINPIAFPGGDDLGIPSMTWLSPEWIEMVKVALKGAAERDIICDIICGSGWPFGGEFLQPEERSQLLTLTGKKVKGAAKLRFQTEELLKEAAPQIHSGYKGASSEVYGFCLAPLEMSVFTPAQTIPFEKGSQEIEVDVPAGEFILYTLVKITGFQSVINGSPGAAGPVLNHYDRKAVDRFLNRMSDELFPAIKDLKSFRALFCDSMELEGANWYSNFIDEFRSRKGYDISPYLPFILYKVGHMGHAIEGESTVLTGEAKEEVARARYDFYTACMAMMRDNFLKPFTEWCNRHGFLSRAQAYGREFHPLDASLDVDIPECETWIFSYSNVNKYVASAAHYAGKKIVSCEEITNTDEVFNLTLERVKTLGDESNLSGVTHSILHGFNYSPLETPFPGWIRYGAYFNERNTWWKYFKQWAAYKTRISAVLQETVFYADVAVMHPLADMWTIHGPQRDPFPELHYPKYQYKVWEAIHRNGNSCDYISENILQQSRFENGCLTYGERKYHTLMLLEVEAMETETAEALSAFVACGGKLIFVGKEPHRSSGLKDYKARNERVKTLVATMKDAYPEKIFTVDAPAAYSDNEMLGWYKNLAERCGVKPYLDISSPNKSLNQIRHRSKDRDLFFVVNSSHTERVVTDVSFAAADGRKANLWDAETGKRYRCANYKDGTLRLELEPATSQLIVFEKDSAADVESAPTAEGRALTGWEVRLEHINGNKQTLSMDVPSTIGGNNAETQSFAGYIYYTKTVDGAAGLQWLDLGKVYGVSELKINGELIGNRWYGRHLYRLPEKLAKAASKTIEIKVTTTLGNYMKSTPENHAHGWTRHQKWHQHGIDGKVYLI